MEETIFDKVKKASPHGGLAIGWWNGGKLQMEFSNLPVEILCYMHQMLGVAISDRLKQLVQGGMTDKH